MAPLAEGQEECEQRRADQQPIADGHQDHDGTGYRAEQEPGRDRQQRPDLQGAEHREVEDAYTAPLRSETEVRSTLAHAEAEHDRLTRQIADDEALRESISREIAGFEDRLRRLMARREEMASQHRQIEAELAALPAMAEVEAAFEAARIAHEEARRHGQESIDKAREAERYESDAAREAVAAAEAARIETERLKAADRQAAEFRHAEAADAAQAIGARLTKLKAEEAGVAASLQSAADSLWPPLLDALNVEPGFEKALGAAFGDDLEASSDRGAPAHWLPLGPYADAPVLPMGAAPLSEHVKALPELARRIAFIGLVADDATGAALQADLKPGQQLVTREGALWRWDGYTMRAGAPVPAAVRLSQRNRLIDIRVQIDAVSAEMTAAQAKLDLAVLKELAGKKIVLGVISLGDPEAETPEVVAARIREVAAEHGVPLLEAPPLARALYRHADVGDEIPARLYSAVAQVLAYVFQLRAQREFGGPAPRAPEALDVPADLDPAAVPS